MSNTEVTVFCKLIGEAASFQHCCVLLAEASNPRLRWSGKEIIECSVEVLLTQLNFKQPTDLFMLEQKNSLKIKPYS